MCKLKLVLLILIFSFVSLPVLAEPLDRVTLKLQWLHQFQFAGYYVAKEKGFYEEVGLNVKIEPYETGNQDVVKLVTSGEVHYGTGRASLIVDKLQGKPVVGLAAIFQKSPSVLLSLADNKIKRVRDLIGRKVMVTKDALFAADIVGMLKANEILPHDIYRQDHSYNLEDLINKKTDAMASYVSNEPYRLRERGIAYVSFHPGDYGQDYYGDMLFTSETEAENRPERIEKFRVASLKGWQYAFDHIEETAHLIKAKYNSQNKSLDSLIFEGEELKKLSYVNGFPLGHIEEDKVRKIANFYYDLGAVAQTNRLAGFQFTK